MFTNKIYTIEDQLMKYKQPEIQLNSLMNFSHCKEEELFIDLLRFYRLHSELVQFWKKLQNETWIGKLRKIKQCAQCLDQLLS